ncbi:MAG: glycosyltransferase family 2 protein [Phycisphaerales bacterium]|nr:MAG: glycosyltransferase family 2 protein [Phycisphaerales bacterium]
MDFSVVIPTKDREEDLAACIESVARQVLLPIEVLVVDDGAIGEGVRRAIEGELGRAGISFRYFKKDKPGSAESKNLGAKEATGELVLFLDDDVVLEREYISSLGQIWEKRGGESRLAGVCGVIRNARAKRRAERVFNRIFCLHSSKSWSILGWGFQTWDYGLRGEQQVEWTPCGLTSFRREVLNRYRFRALEQGRTALEDLEFCWRLLRDGYHFIMAESAGLVHKAASAGREGAFAAGYKEGYNRCLIFQRHAEKSFKNRLCFLVASVGWIIRKWFAAFLEPRSAAKYLLCGLGIIAGNFGFLLNRLCKRNES